MEDPVIQKVREAHGSLVEFRKIDDSEQRKVASTMIDNVLSLIEDGKWKLEPWEKQCLNNANAHLLNGRVEQAFVEAEAALVPLDRRSGVAIYAPEDIPDLTVEKLRVDWEHTRALST